MAPENDKYPNASYNLNKDWHPFSLQCCYNSEFVPNVLNVKLPVTTLHLDENKWNIFLSFIPSPLNNMLRKWSFVKVASILNLSERATTVSMWISLLNASIPSILNMCRDLTLAQNFC